MSTFDVRAYTITIRPHPDPEVNAIEMAEIDGTSYVSIVRKDDGYKTGDVVLYIPEQALVPESILREMGLWDDENAKGGLAGSKGNRVKAIRLRGVFSQGLVYVPNGKTNELELGKDYAVELGIEKWIPAVPTSMSGKTAPCAGIVTYTDIENVKHFPDVLIDGEEVIVSEKIHGCLESNQRVLLADMSSRSIRSLVNSSFAGEVMGMNADGTLTTTPVLRVFRNPPTDKWLKIRFTRNQAGRGSASGALIVTPSHRIYVPTSPLADCSGYVEARFLATGDRLTMFRAEPRINPLARQVLIGKMLGDGSLSISRNSMSAFVSFGHKAAHEEYLDWTLRCLGDIANTAKDTVMSGYGTTIRRGKTIQMAPILDFLHDWVGTDGHKHVPPSIVSTLGPIALAFWYMDDGSLTHFSGQEDRISLATNGFDRNDVELLTSALARLGIVETVIHNSSGWRIRINGDSAEQFFLLVAPYVPRVMQYKLPERYRGGESWHPVLEHSYRQFLTSQEVVSVSPVETHLSSKVTFDLQTGTGNFFANGVLVHNSNVVLRNDGNFHLSSKGMSGKSLELLEEMDEGGRHKNAYWRVARQVDIPAKLEEMRRALGDPAAVSLYGEVYGDGIQDLHYGLKGGIDFIAFDVMVEDSGVRRYLDFDEARQLVEGVGLRFVPELYRGPYDRDVIWATASGKEQVSGRELHLREGVVVKPIHERVDPRMGRVVLKFVSDDYLLRKGNVTEFE